MSQAESPGLRRSRGISIQKGTMRNNDRLLGRIPPLKDLTVQRFTSGVWRHAQHALRDGLVRSTQPFRSEFQKTLIRNKNSAEPAVLDQLRQHDELKTSSWFGLAKFGYRLVETFRPRVIVELGTHVGLSALAMGLAQHEFCPGGQLYAVDNWEGDEHIGMYGDVVYNTFLQRRDALGLTDTIVPLRMYFDQALSQVPAVIDLLHIDGLHTWEAVAHDWVTFGPRVRPGGIVIFHDITSQWQDVGDFWSCLRLRLDSFTVLQSNGLGVVRIPESGWSDRLVVRPPARA